MVFQKTLHQAFTTWKPTPPTVEENTKHDVTMSWSQHDLVFLEEGLLYRIERRERVPKWVVEYSGGKTRSKIENLAPCSPHKFRLKVIVKSETVPHLAERAIAYYGSESIAIEKLKEGLFKHVTVDSYRDDNIECGQGDGSRVRDVDNVTKVIDEGGDRSRSEKRWLESLWSEEVYTSTESEGTSAMCFCMAVRGGYLKQTQIMLEERPALIEILNPTTGYTPLATAIREGDVNMVKYLLAAGADVDQTSANEQTPLHLAVLHAQVTIVDLLLEKGADFEARDINGLRVEHFAVDSGDIETLRHVMQKEEADVTVRDKQGWTPLCRAICQGATTAIVEELVRRGSDVEVTDNAGLTVAAIARTLTNRHGHPRESILRLVDPQYPHEKALANFTRLTKKISNVHSLLKM